MTPDAPAAGRATAWEHPAREPLAGAESVTFVVDAPVRLYAIAPVLEQAARRGIGMYVYFGPGVHEHLLKLKLPSHVIVRDLRTVWSAFPVARWIHRLVESLFTPRDFSPQYALLSRTERQDLSIKARLVYRLSHVFPSWRPDTINRRVRACVNPFVRNVFPTRRVIVVSRFSRPHLLCADDQEVFTFLESWDHPVKRPVGYVSARVFVWNDDLANDWRSVQGDDAVIASYPLKLRYAAEAGRGRAARAARRTTSRASTALYAAGTSSLSYINSLFDEELVLIDALCRATLETGWQFLIKPKPNGRAGDFDRFTRTYEHVRVGAYREVRDTADYYLDDEYNATRFAELAECNLVISSITTFALDAAAWGSPVLQLDLRGAVDLPQLARISTNHHLSRYVLNREGLTLRVTGAEHVRSAVAQILRSGDPRPEEFAAALRDWISPCRRLNESVDELVGYIVG